MITWQQVSGGEGVLVARDRDTRRPEDLNALILGSGWTLRFSIEYGRLLLEVWGPAELAAAPAAEEFITLDQAEAEYGVPVADLVAAMLEDGLLLDIDGELVASPHPAIETVTTRREQP